MKLSPKKSHATAAAYWHPDFRDVAALPDLKVVRTSFFVNVVCITLATIALLFTAYREYEAFSRRSEINAAEESMTAKQARNNELLGLSREFSEMNLRFQEAEKFMQAPFVASELLIALSASLPNHMDFTRVAYGDGVLTLRGTIRGASETASTRVAAYQDVLRQDKLLGTLFPDVSLKSLDRDPRTQGLSFELVLKAPKGPATATPKKGGKAKS
jgi:Tfp pilus assembly protein PilN